MSRVITRTLVKRAAPLVLNVFALRSRIRDRGDLGARKAFREIQGERSPAAAKLEHTLTVGQPCARRRQGERRFLRLRQRAHAIAPMACAVFESGPSARAKKAAGTS